MDQRDSIPLTGSASYYLHHGTAETRTGLQNSGAGVQFHSHSNPGSGLTVPALPLDTSSTMHGLGVSIPPSSLQQSEPVRRKRGRPRKYGHDGGVSLALSPSVPNHRLAQKWRPGAGRKQQLSSPGVSMFSGAGTMAPHIIKINAGEDIKRRILALLQGRRGVVLLSAIGSISAANIRTSSSSGSITYEGHFDMVNLSGSYINDLDGLSGGLNVTFAGPDGRLIGGPVDGILVAAAPVQVIVGILVPSSTKPKTKGSDDPEASGDQDGGFGDSLLPPSNMQHSQNVASLGGWQS